MTCALVILGAAAPSHAGVVIDNTSFDASTGKSNPTLVPNAQINAGTHLLVAVTTSPSASVSVSDNVGSTYALLASATESAYVKTYLYLALLGSEMPASTGRINVNSSSYVADAVVLAIGGLVTAGSPADGSAVGNDIWSTAMSTGSVTPTTSSTLLVSAFGWSDNTNNASPGSGWAEQKENEAGALQVQTRQVTSGSHSASGALTADDRWAGVLVALKIRPPQSPIDITLSNSTIEVGEPANSLVGTLAAVDPDVGETHTFTLVPGIGDTHNSSFTISGNELRTAAPLAAGTYSIRINVNDGTYDLVEVFSITVSVYPLVTGGDTSYGDSITNVTFAGINNTSGSSTSGYQDFTSLTGTVARGLGSSFSVTVNVGCPTGAEPNCGGVAYPQYIMVWFDWNRDSDFNDSGENYVVTTSTVENGPHTIMVNVPGAASLGGTRMRVVNNADDGTPPPPNSGSDLFFGEAEDYSITVIDLLPPTITSATYNASTGVLAVTCTNVTAGSTIAVNKLTLTGEGPSGYMLTTANVSASSSTAFSVTLNATDRANVDPMLNKNGMSSTSGTTYNLAAADDWDSNFTTGDTTDATNPVTVSGVPAPTITSVTYDASTGVLAVTGTGFLKKAGATNDIDVSMLTIRGEGGGTRALTSTSDVEITSATAFTVTLAVADRTAVDLLINHNGTSSLDSTTYNLAAAEDWAVGADPAVVVADATGNGITASNVAEPEISVEGNSVTIADGDTVPTTADHTDFGNADVATGTVVRTFTVRNTGRRELNLTGSPLVAISGANAGDFTVTVPPASAVAALTGTTTFSVQFDPSATGARTATISVANDDADESPYNFAIQGNGTAPGIVVTGNATEIPDGDVSPGPEDHTDFGEAAVAGGTVTRTFTITNTGSVELILTGATPVTVSGAHAGDFTVTVQPASPLAALIGSTTFSVRFDPSATGARTATISIANDDANKSPYEFAIVGTGVGSPTGFFALEPCRVFDTRVDSGIAAGAPALAAWQRRLFVATGKCGIPVDAVAISVNVTVVGATATGDLVVVGGHISATVVTALPVPLARARANNALVQLSTTGDGTVAVTNSTAGTVHVILDVNGYFR
jgi:hypothetical protein